MSDVIDRQTPSANGLWRIVAAREIDVRMRSKSFIWSTVITMVLVAAAVVFGMSAMDRDEVSKIAVVDEHSAAMVEAGSRTASQIDDQRSFEAVEYDDTAAAERAVRDGDVDAAVFTIGGSTELVGDNEVDALVQEAMRGAISELAVEANAQDQNVDLAQLYDGSQVTQRLLSPDAETHGVRQAVAFGFVLVFYLCALLFGMQIATSVTQEKESRVVEILASAVPLRALLWGKVAGNSVLAIAQVVAVVLVATIALAGTGRRAELGAVGPSMIWYVVFFVIGFVALASFWAMAGAMASRQQDLQSTTMPIQMLLLVPYMLWFAGSDRVREIVSMLPIISTMIMPPRLATGDVPWWQLVVAVATTLIAAVLIVRIAAQVYERSLLRTDSISFKEVLRRS